MMTNSRQSQTLWLPGMSPDAPLYQQPTLRSYFEESFLPSSLERGLSKDRIGELRQAIHRYEWWSQTKDRIAHPVLVSVTQTQLSRFRRDCLGAEIPGRDGKIRVVSARSLNKTLEVIEAVVRAALEDGQIDESRGLVRIRKCAYTPSVRKYRAPDVHLAAILDAAKSATWPQQFEGRAVDAPLLWQTAIVLYSNFGMRTQDLMAHEEGKQPIRWSCVLPAGQSPFGSHDSDHGWLFWRPNKTKRTKANFTLCHPLNATIRHWLDRLCDGHKPKPTEPIFPVPRNKASLYDQWRRIMTEAGVRPKPIVTLDAEGNVVSELREYTPWHLRGTAGTRANDHGESIGHPGMGRLLLGHGSKEVFETNYRSSELPLIKTIQTLPQPDGFAPSPVDRPPALRIVG